MRPERQQRPAGAQQTRSDPRIHDAYFEAGADIIETNTFNSTTIAMADYQMESLSAEINFAAAKLARASADADGPHAGKPRYVAGVLARPTAPPLSRLM